jgi:hypothetical protein
MYTKKVHNVIGKKVYELIKIVNYKFEFESIV